MSDEVKSQVAHVDVLYRAARSVIHLHDLQEVFQTIVDGAAGALQADRVLLFAVDVDIEQVTHIAKGGPDPAPIAPVNFAELREGLAGWAMRERQTAFSAKAMLIGDPRESPEVRRRRAELGIGSLLVTPILYRERVLGILSAVNTMAQPDFTAEDVALIEALADQAAAAIQNVKLLTETRYRAQLLAAGADVARVVSSILSLEEMLPQVVGLIQERFGLYYAGLFLLDRAGRWAELRAGSGEAGQQLLAVSHRLEVGGASMIGACVADGQARIALDVGQEARRFDNPYLPQTHSEMALPLIGRGRRILGAMTIQSERVAAFSVDDITILQTMTDQIATAIENALLFEQREQRIKELSVLSDLQQALALAGDLDAILRNAYAQISRVFDTQDFYIATYREGSDEWTLAFQMAHGELQPSSMHKLGQGLTGYIIRNRQPLHLANLAENRAFMESQGLGLIGDEARSWLGVPLITADKVVGVMAIENYEIENLFTPSDQDLLSTIALQMANAVEANRLFVEVGQRAVQLQTAAEVARATSSILDPEELLPRAVELIRDRFDYYYVGVFLTDAERRWALLRAGTGEAGRRMLEAGHRLEVGGASMIGVCIADARARIALDVGAEAVRFDNPHLPETHSEMAVPLRRGEQAIGALTVQSTARGAFSEEDITLMTTIADQLATALENARLFAESQRGLEAISRKDAEQSALINNIPDTVYFKDLELRFTRVNPAQAGVLGVSAPELAVGKTDLDFFVGPSAEIAWEDDLRVVRDGASVIGRLERMVNREGQSRWFSTTKIPMREASGQIIGLVGISSDVTELKTLQDAAQQRAVQLQQAALISRTLSAILDSTELLSQATTLIHERLGFAGVGIFLQDEAPSTAQTGAARWLALRAGVGERVAEHLEANLRLPLAGSSLVAMSAVRREAQLGTEVSVPLIAQIAGDGHIAELALPLLRGEQTLGVLCIQSTTPEGFGEDDIAVLQTVADQLANALEIARLLADADRNVRQLETVVGTYTLESWREFVAKAGRLRGYRYRGFELEVATERTPEAEQAWRDGQPVMYRQTSASAMVGDATLAVLAVPIRVREQVIGVLNVRSRGGELAPDVIPLLEEVGARLGQALETARLLEDTRARATREQLIGEISGRVRAEVEVESLLERALRELSLALGVRRAAVELEVKE